MSVELLDKTRKLGRLLHDASSSTVVFTDICEVLANTLSSNVLVLSEKGKVLGVGMNKDVSPIKELLTDVVGERIDRALAERLTDIKSTKENVDLKTLGFSGKGTKNCRALITPVQIAGDHLGTVFCYRYENPYEIDDIILGEYGTTVVSLAMVRSVDEETETRQRKIRDVRSAISTLSHSEMEAVISIFDELGGTEGILVASKVADRVGITRSVIVNALRKFESAGVIESRSSGMKGTYIKILNEQVFEELAEVRKNRTTK